jgi:hypothetical protein
MDIAPMIAWPGIRTACAMSGPNSEWKASRAARLGHVPCPARSNASILVFPLAGYNGGIPSDQDIVTMHQDNHTEGRP